MPKVTSLPDNIDIEVADGETLLEAALRSGIPWAHACGGQARCSTCRTWILDGIDHCPPRTPDETTIANRVGLSNEVRLACQLRPNGPLRVRRLVLDDTDLLLTNQINRAPAKRDGEVKNITVFFSDIADFTTISESLSPYDVMYLLNRYFAQAGEIIERNGGYIDKFIGDGVMAIFGVEDAPDAPIRSVNAALQTLAAVDRLKPFFKSMYNVDFDIRIGLHYGEALVGSIGPLGHERLTAIGDVVNVASRVEAANKDAGTRLLISQALHDKIEDKVQAEDFIRTRLRGTSERITLYEIARLKPEVEAELNARELRDTMYFAGRDWIRAFAEDELTVGEHRILEFENFDAVVVRSPKGYHAFSNACPHLKLPLYERRMIASDNLPLPRDSCVTEELTLVCRWHHSSYDLQTGEIKSWCAALNPDGTPSGYEFIGDVSKNRAPLMLFACRIHEGYLWISPQ
jgi:class 3 adenylate cyclase/nitrite reductase/ring-hydroxylating ferredoxin subunit